mgnify:CR=1 FL=1
MRNMEPDNLKTNFKNKKNGLVSILIILMVVIVCCIAIWYFSIKMTDNSNKNDKPMTTTTSTTTTAKPKKEYSMYIGIACMVIVGIFVLGKMQVVLNTINKLCEYINIDMAYIKLLLKMIGITYIAEFSSQICKDAGKESISKQIELAAKFSILTLSMPVVINVIEIIKQILR